METVTVSIRLIRGVFVEGPQERGQTRLRSKTRYCLLVSKKSPKSLFA